MYEDLVDCPFVMSGLVDSWQKVPFPLAVVVCRQGVSADGCE